MLSTHGSRGTYRKIPYSGDPCLLVWRGGLATGRVIVILRNASSSTSEHKIGGVARLWKGDSGKLYPCCPAPVSHYFLLLWSRAGMEPAGLISP